jgi:AcrR family transcriptional regulator
MTEGTLGTLDPRIRRTRQLMQQALAKLLENKELDEISVQDIADAATINRTTFYDHYTDKFSLLECMVGSRFHDLLAERDLQFDAGCQSALKAIVMMLCDYLARMKGPDCKRQLEPHMETAIIAVVRRTLLEGLQRHPREDAIAPEMVAATASWAIYGAVKEWVRTPDRCSPEEIAQTVMTLVAPIFLQTQPESNRE